MLKEDVYGEPEIIKTNNIVARVYSPILTDEERNRRMEQIKRAAVRIVLAQEELKRRTETDVSQTAR